MTDNGDQLSAWRRHLVAAGAEAKARDDCPSSEELWDAANGYGNPARNRTLLAHVAGCEVCTESWSLARELGADESAAQTSPAHLSSAGAARWWPAAAGLLLVLGVLWGLRSMRGDETTSPPVLRGEELVIFDEVGAQGLSPAAPVLRWTPVDGAVAYRLVVTDGALEVLVDRSELLEPQFQLAEDQLSSLVGSRILWRVEARLPDGTVVRSDTFESEVRSDP